ncbi:hypothetical protein ACVIWV_006149 [Bradyrhizobium diazoefficiens]|uniref:DNA cytosine methyltransferase n=3 Tax=Nitrobacteraceae TaxID=41294 RepID=A0A7Z0TTS6_9BRAD|nr:MULTISPECIES: hypothetical protein [Bradyrhizobium]MBR0867785.1 hypothetical protein [Bradyrhizobium diazoefficiens]MBR0892248.1 hypothetical protein [Bradyrhizobium diazoefficiens]MBR0924001.1 hypothetical protein [Bradyrhizobium diazoefficiens]UGX90288.1 hypothetical protein G6321_00031125 [Bradyrhizobium barranii subsp. barranii]UQE01133.1 hypothetical protein JEY30_13880 [Bradyrhizobium japonicum]
MNAGGIVLSLCDRTGTMVLPWIEAGYSAITVDLQPAPREHHRRQHVVADITQWRYPPHLPRPVIVFAFPPCSHLAVSGARWWFKGKGLGALIHALQVVDASRRACEDSGAPYMIENPVSTLSTYWRDPDYTFDPCDYDAPYTKQTCLWVGGGFVMPEKVRVGDLFAEPTCVEPVLGSAILNFSPTADRADTRRITPQVSRARYFEPTPGGSDGTHQDDQARVSAI